MQNLDDLESKYQPLMQKSFFEVEGPELVPREYADWECAKNEAILLSNLTNEDASDEQKKQLMAAFKRANELEDIAYDAYHLARAREYGRWAAYRPLS